MSTPYDYSTMTMPQSPEDALIAKLTQIRGKFRESGFSEIETGRLTESFMRNYLSVVSEPGGGNAHK